MKKILLMAAFMGYAAIASASASTQWTLTKAAWPYQVDVTYQATVGPGTTLTKMTLTSLPRPSDGKTNTETPLIKAFYMTVDLTNPEVSVKTFLAGDKRGVRQDLPTIATSHETENMQVIGGVNSDFFNMSVPYLTNGAVVSDGFQLAPQNEAPWAHLMLDGENAASFLGDVNFYRSIRFGDDTSSSALGVNVTRSANAYVIYYQDEYAWQPVYNRNKWGCEVYVKPVDAEKWGLPSSEWEVVSAPSTPNTVDGSAFPIDGGEFVLSGNGSAANRISALRPGDRFKVETSMVSGGNFYTPRQLAGGRKMILTDGVQIDISSSNDPRTLVGASEDGKTLVMMCIDGRNAGGSYGAYYRLCAAIMQAVGCHNAMEFDGGGSTTMYVKPVGGVQNIPSEGSLRTVAEGLFVTASAVDDWNVTAIEVVEKEISIPSGSTFSPTVYGFNSKGHLIDSNVKDYMLECDEAPSAVSFDGKQFTPSSDGEYSLRVRYGQLSVTVPVKVGGSSGIDGIQADDAQPVYFNMQGMRVDRPATGVYIRRSGDRIEKVIVK